MASPSEIASRLDRALKAASVPIVSVSIGDMTQRSTWLVMPSSLQAQAQPIIDAFDPDASGEVTLDLDTQVKGYIDRERVFSALVWAIIDTYSAPATIAKYNAARTKIISAFKSRPWLP